MKKIKEECILENSTHTQTRLHSLIALNKLSREKGVLIVILIVIII